MSALVKVILSVNKNLKPRCFRIFLVLATSMVSVLYLLFIREDPSILKNINSRDWQPPKECTFPSSDPFDPSLEGVIKKHPPVDCSKETLNIVYMDKYVLKLNSTKLKQIKMMGAKFSHCRYKEIARKKGSDKAFEYTWFSRNFTDSIPLPLWHNNVVSECFDVNGNIISRSYFPLIRKNPQTEAILDKNYQAHIAKHSPTETLSILVFGIDGMSKQHFERAMPKTRNFLLEKLGAIELYKYNKLAFETFPNVLPLLTGHTLEEFYKGWRYNRAEFVDQINEAFIWTDARKIGYRTGMMLDAYDLTAFHYQKKGFKVSPVDYYQRATVIASSRDRLMRSRDNHCIGDIPEVTQVQDYWLQMVSTFGKNRSTPFFAYSFATRFTHDDSDYAYKGDVVYYKFLQDLVATDSLDNTVIVWFSDHGPRFGPIRETYHGRIETSTPYLFFVFPPWFKRKYPELIDTLKINQHRLSSHFDVYETLRELLFFKSYKRSAGSLKERGISLFREIPKYRTCANAGIPQEFCACGKFSQPKVTRETLAILGTTLLNRVNSFLGFEPISALNGSSVFNLSPDVSKPTKVKDVSELTLSRDSKISEPEKWKKAPSLSDNTKRKTGSPDFRDKCTRLSLVKVESLYEVSVDQMYGMKAKVFRVTIRASPGFGLFEALVSHERGQGSGQVKGEVVRINMYRGQAECVQDPWLRQFCFCVK